MERRATIYVSKHSNGSQGIKRLLDGNRIAYTEVDITLNTAIHQLILEKTGQLSVPVVELDGVFAAGTDILELSRTLGLKVRPLCGPTLSCC